SNTRRPLARYEERQNPGLLLLGWNHRWSPGVNTLVLAGRLAADERLSDPNVVQAVLGRDPSFLEPDFLRRSPTGALEYTSATLRSPTTPPVSSPADGPTSLSDDFRFAIAPFLGRAPVTAVFSDQFDLGMQRKFETYSSDIQHVWQTRGNTVLA